MVVSLVGELHAKSCTLTHLGVGIELLKDHPTRTTYFYPAVPMFAVIMSILLLKQKGFVHVHQHLFTVFRALTKSRDYSTNLEM
jgi:hypothetical protein